MIDVSQLSLAERKELLFKAGHLRHLARDYQLPIYDAFHAWKRGRRDAENIRLARRRGARLHNLFTMLLSRRYGKTSLALIFGVEEMIQRPGSAGLIACPTKNMVGAIILKCIADVFADAPDGYKPEYHSSWNGLNDVLVLPATGSYARLVGLDLHADRLRGTALDWAHLSEAAYTRFDIDETWRAVVAPQFRGRPDSWALIESSYAESPDHPVHSVFAADAALRGALVERSIRDQGLSAEEIRYEEDQCGGPDHPTCRRELHNEHVPDRARAVCTSFDAAINVVPADYPLPTYGLGIVGLDPGNTDQAGLTWMLVDPSKREAIIVTSWGGSNVNTFTLAELIRDRELKLFGTRAEVSSIPVSRSLNDILKAPREVPLVGIDMERLSIDGIDVDAYEPIYEAPEGAITWWDDQLKTLRPNPWRRVSDVDKQQLQDLRELYGLRFETPTKAAGNMKMQIDLLNSLMHDGVLKILDNAENAMLLKQIRSGRWNARRTDFERTASMGHLDVLVSAAIGCRAIDFTIDPRRPLHVVHPGAGYFTPPEARRLMEPQRPAPAKRYR